jgi:hypothetical protein
MIGTDNYWKTLMVLYKKNRQDVPDEDMGFIFHI